MQSWIVIDTECFCTFDYRFTYTGADIQFVSTSEEEAVQWARTKLKFMETDDRYYSDSDIARSGRTMYEFNNWNGSEKLLVFAEEDMLCCEAWLAHKWR